MIDSVTTPPEYEPQDYERDRELELEVDDVLAQLPRLVEKITDPTVRLRVLNTILDGVQARHLQGERQKLDPWGQWMHSTYLDASTGHADWRESAETRRIIDHWRGGQTAEGEFSDERLDANLIVSDTGIDDSRGRRLHVPMFDIDLPMRVVPSTNPGKGHLYINKPMPWDRLMKLLDAFVEAGIVHKNYREHSAERGSTTLRPAFVRKPDKGWSSDADTVLPDGWEDDPMVPDWAKPTIFVDTQVAILQGEEEIATCAPFVTLDQTISPVDFGESWRD